MWSPPLSVKSDLEQKSGVEVGTRLALGVGAESNTSARWLTGWFHELADGIKDHPELGIVFLLQSVEFLAQVLVGGEHLTELHEGPHDGDVDLNCTVAAEDAGGHSHTLLGKSVGDVAGLAAFAMDTHMRYAPAYGDVFDQRVVSSSRRKP